MQRILRGTAVTLYGTFQIDGVPTDPNPAEATVTISRSDGTAVVTDEVAAHGTDGVFSTTLTPADTALLDTLTAVWTSSLGSITTVTEIVGGFLFSIAEARAVGLSEAQYTAAQIVGMRVLIEQKLERTCGRAFVPRYTLESVAPSQPMLRFPDVLAIRSTTRAGTVLAPATDYAWISGGLGYVNHGYYSTTTDLVVGYEYGMTALEEPIRSAALQEAKQSLTVGTSGSDPRIVSFTTDDGSVRYTDVSQGAGFLSQDANWVADNYNMAVGVA